MPARNWHHPEVGAAKAASRFNVGAVMKLQISLEILTGMLLSLLVTASILHAFQGAHQLLVGTQSALATIARISSHYASQFGA